MTPEPDLQAPEAQAPVAVEEPDEQTETSEMRCKGCDKFLTRLIVTVDRLGEGAKRKVVKVGLETKCPRCKEFCYHLFVV